LQHWQLSYPKHTPGTPEQAEQQAVKAVNPQSTEDPANKSTIAPITST